MGGDDPMDERDVIAERGHLLALGYRMLGTLADAEDAVQETFARWYRLDDAERAAIENPAAWLTRVAGRICLDVLGSARARREQYVGPWLPEPLPTDAVAARGPADPADPADRATLDDEVSTALLLVLESMTPAERVAFVLHDVFAVPFPDVAEIVGRSPAAVRQLASSARRRVQDGRGTPVPRERHDAVVRSFAAACGGGDLAALTALLDPDVVLRSDGGGVVSAARHPIRGAEKVARFLIGVLAKNPGSLVDERRSGDGLTLVTTLDGQLCSVTTFGVRDELITDLRVVLNPAKLTAWSAS